MRRYRKFQPILLMCLVAVLAILVVFPVKSYAQWSLIPGIQTWSEFGPTCECPEWPEFTCGCKIWSSK